MREVYDSTTATAWERDGEGQGSRVPVHQASRERTVICLAWLDAGRFLNSVCVVIYLEGHACIAIRQPLECRARCACSGVYQGYRSARPADVVC